MTLNLYQGKIQHQNTFSCK